MPFAASMFHLTIPLQTQYTFIFFFLVRLTCFLSTSTAPENCTLIYFFCSATAHNPSCELQEKPFYSVYSKRQPKMLILDLLRPFLQLSIHQRCFLLLVNVKQTNKQTVVSLITALTTYSVSCSVSWFHSDMKKRLFDLEKMRVAAHNKHASTSCPCLHYFTVCCGMLFSVLQLSLWHYVTPGEILQLLFQYQEIMSK